MWLGSFLKYLGIVLECKETTFCADLRAVSEKVQRVMAALSSLMLNIGGPREDRRRLLMSSVQSVLLYGVPTRAPSLARDLMEHRRTSIRSVRARRTISNDAVTVVAGTLPIDLMTLEHYNAFKARRGHLVAVTVDGPPETQAMSRWPAPDFFSPKEMALTEWTRRVSHSDASANSEREWTRMPIPPDPLDLTQLLTGHCCFNRFLYHIGRAPSPGYFYCRSLGSYGEDEEDVFHTLCRYEAFDGYRDVLVLRIGRFEPNDLVPCMLESLDTRIAVIHFAKSVLTEVVEHKRQISHGVTPPRGSCRCKAIRVHP